MRIKCAGCWCHSLTKTSDGHYICDNCKLIQPVIEASMSIPLRVDFAGSWLDVPRYAIPGAFVVNCAISPLVVYDPFMRALLWDDGTPPSAKPLPMRHEKRIVPNGSGLGTSAAWHILNGRDAIAEELASGCGWQDPAVLQRAGLCVWASGATPVLVDWDRGDWLRGHMALYWTGKTHNSSKIAEMERSYVHIAGAADHAAKAVQYQSLDGLSWAVQLTYERQLREGMERLPEAGLAWKYCGAGHGGYAVYLFESHRERDAAVQEKGFMAVEPYCK
jgi:hypothetical protein